MQPRGSDRGGSHRLCAGRGTALRRVHGIHLPATRRQGEKQWKEIPVRGALKKRKVEELTVCLIQGKKVAIR